MFKKQLEIIVGDVRKVSEEIARRTIAEIQEAQKAGRNYVMACAKGSSAVEYYKDLRQSDRDFSGVVAFCIDEDLGTSNAVNFLVKNLPPNILINGIDAKFYQDGQLVDSNLFQQIMKTTPVYYGLIGREINPRGPSGLPAEIKEACQSYEERIEAKGVIDIAIIGLGVDPMHIGSNFPPTCDDSRTHLGEKVDAEGNVIGYAMTMGIATLCSARQVVLFAAGEKKAEGVRVMMEEPIGPSCPPSYLRNMGNLVLALDQTATSMLDLNELPRIYRDRGLVLRCR